MLLQHYCDCVSHSDASEKTSGSSPSFFRQGRGAEILCCGQTVFQPTTKSGSAVAHGQQTHRTTGALYWFLYEVFKGLLYHCKQKIPGLMKLIPISFLCKV